jgi:hypothetical protein
MMNLEHIFLDFGPVSFHLVETHSSDITLETLHAIAVQNPNLPLRAWLTLNQQSRSEPNA